MGQISALECALRYIADERTTDAAATKSVAESIATATLNFQKYVIAKKETYSRDEILRTLDDLQALMRNTSPH